MSDPAKAVHIDPQTLNYVYRDDRNRQFTLNEINDLDLRCPRCQAQAIVTPVSNESLAQMQAQTYQLGSWRCSGGCS